MNTTSDDTVLETPRLVLRRWRVADAGVQRELWTERDPRVPPHRRIGADGRPTLADIEARILRGDPEGAPGLLVVEERNSGVVVGYCGLIPNVHGQDHEPELAYEFLRRSWGRGYATEAAQAVLAWAGGLGYETLWATIRDWNAASRRVAEKLGFVLTDRVDPSEAYGHSLYYRRDL